MTLVSVTINGQEQIARYQDVQQQMDEFVQEMEHVFPNLMDKWNVNVQPTFLAVRVKIFIVQTRHVIAMDHVKRALVFGIKFVNASLSGQVTSVRLQLK